MTEERVKLLNNRQKNGFVHPYTCNRDKLDCEVRSQKGDGILIATADGWVCPCGQYKQDFGKDKDEILFGSEEENREKLHQVLVELELGKINADIAETYIQSLVFSLQDNEIKRKANKWDNLEKEISKFYLNKNGDYDENNPELDGDLCSIGELAAQSFGWL